MPPPGLFQKEDSFSRRRWKQVQYLADIFWKRWSKEYLPLLQSKQRWTTIRKNLATGDIVLVSAENSSRNLWPLGRVVEVFADKKGLVCCTRVKVKGAILEMKIDKLCLLIEAYTFPLE